jgi:Zn-dependent protease with chaperone function
VVAFTTKAMHVKASRQVITLGSVCLIVASLAAGQEWNEYTLATAYRYQLIQQYSTVEGTPANVIGQSVFNDLTRALPASYQAKPYELMILADPSVNACSIGAGKVFVNFGLVSLLGENRGLWAAVLGHELSHDLLQHTYRNYLLIMSEQRTQAALAQAQAQTSSTTAVIMLALGQVGSQWLGLKVLRDEENQADSAGMLIMARAGYHPDFALKLNRILSQNTGDASRFQAFFQNHPRMATRALRELKEYDQADQEFRQLWPDASQSPGGLPPPVAIIKSVSTSRDKPSKTLLLSAEIEAHNVEPSALMVFATFQDHGSLVHSESKENSLNGLLVGFGSLEGEGAKHPDYDPYAELGAANEGKAARPERISGSKVYTWKIKVPNSALSGGHRKLKSSVAVGFNEAGDSVVLDLSSLTDVEFPK